MSGLGDAIKKGVGLVHGTGEALRGNFNAAADRASGDHVTAARHEAIASKGADEIDRGYHREHGANAGVTPVDKDANHNLGPHAPSTRDQIDPLQSSTTGPQTGSTNYGPHDTNVGNKLNPRYDSSTGAGSTNYGPHDTNTGNQLDPRVDSRFGTRQ